MGKRKHRLPPHFDAQGSRVHKQAAPGGPSLSSQDDLDLTMDDDEGVGNKTTSNPSVSARPPVITSLTSHKNVPSYERKFEFSANDTSPKVSTLRRKDEKPTPMFIPRVYYTPLVFDTLWRLVHMCEKEVGWLGYVETLPRGDFLITDLFVPEQTVSGTETDISGEAMAELALQLINEGKDPGKLIYWGHSHVNMGVSPSGQDERQIDEYLNHCPQFIRGIYNKRGEAKVDVFDRDGGHVYQCVFHRIYSPGLTDEQVNALLETVKANVRERQYTYSGRGYQGSFTGHL